MTRHMILSLDVWGNEQDGFELNQAIESGVVVEIPEDATDEQALKI